MTGWSEDELRKKIGQLFIVGFHGIVPSDDIKTLIQTHKVGAVILFLRNIESAAQLLHLTNTLQRLARESGHDQGLFISIDQENGLVTRIKPPIAVQLPGAMTLGATGNAENAYKVAASTAETLKNFGINMNYAPVADVNSEPKNPVIGVRSPSDDPETVGRFLTAQIKGLKEVGIVPCIKHFPGHGDTAVDSHYGLPVINKTKTELEACELIPFRRAAVEGVDSVMTAHIALPGIADPTSDDYEISKTLPASLNADVMKILRDELKYEGMIVSDCLEMDGVRATFGTERGAVMALKAGTDCVMICHTMSAQVGAIEQVVQAVKSGEISQEQIEASVKKVAAIKNQYVHAEKDVIMHTVVEDAMRNSKQALLAADIYSQSTTLVRAAPGIIPISSTEHRIVFVSPGGIKDAGGAVESGEEKTREPFTPSSYIDIIKAQYPNTVVVKFPNDANPSSEDDNLINAADTVVLATRNASLSSYQKEYGISLGKKLGKKLIVVATCDPYDFLEETEEIKNYITIYEPTIPAFKAAVDVIFGIAEAKGSLPVARLATKHEIRDLTTSQDDIRTLWNMWQKIFPSWQIDLPRMTKLLLQPHGRHYLHEKGFCISFLMEGPHGKIAAVAVLPEYRGKGLGAAFVTKAQTDLRTRARDEKLGPLKSLAFGSVFPRFWCQPSIDLPQETKEFFMHRGFRRSTAATARDLFRDITGAVAPPATLNRVSKLNLEFSPWSAELYAECMTKQRKNFKNIGWVEAYERLAAANQYHEVMVAFDPATNVQLGWTLMCSQSAVVSDDFAFLPLMPSKEKTGLIACVGVDESARGRGVGLALLVKAMENMKSRGIEGVCIDWVVIRGFYENLGFRPMWEYEGYDW